jgi:hypothetical protein
MKHRFDSTLSIYRKTTDKGPKNVIQTVEQLVSTERCKVLKEETVAKMEEKPIVFVVKKVIAIRKGTDIRLGDEVDMDNRRYLVTAAPPRRYWTEISVVCEVNGNGTQ